jgi:carbon monoxide dehydrogenase subunit G
MHFANSVTIRRSASEVFAFLIDPANIPKWNYAIDSARQVSPGPVGVGTRIQQTRSIPRPATEELVITDLVPGRRMVLEGDIGPLSGTLDYQVEEVPEGTKLTNTAELSGHGPLRLLAPLAARRVRDAVAANLDKLRNLLESSA